MRSIAECPWKEYRGYDILVGSQGFACCVSRFRFMPGEQARRLGPDDEGSGLHAVSFVRTRWLLVARVEDSGVDVVRIQPPSAVQMAQDVLLRDG